MLKQKYLLETRKLSYLQAKKSMEKYFRVFKPSYDNGPAPSS